MLPANSNVLNWVFYKIPRQSIKCQLLPGKVQNLHINYKYFLKYHIVCRKLHFVGKVNWLIAL